MMISETISHYRIIDQLGEGGTAVVYLAEDVTLGRRVLMKLLSSITKELRGKFLREARALSAFTHPNLATVFEYGETAENQPYIVMEYVNGESLSDKLRKGPLPLPEAMRIVSSIAAGLAETHHRGFVHCDLKPSNVRITKHGLVKLIDFGVARKVGDRRSDASQEILISMALGAYPGSLGDPACYLSPEQIIGHPQGKSTDLFALGAVLYECISGLPAFSGANLHEGFEQVLHYNPPVPSKVNPLVPAELDRITMKALEKKVKERYQSADQIIEALRSVPLTLDYDSAARVANFEPKRLRLKASSPSLQDFESEFDDLVARMQEPKSKRALKLAFASSPAQLGRAAVRQARKKR